MSDAMKNMGYRRDAGLSPIERLAGLRHRIEQGAQAFLDWWLGELLQMVPDALRRRIAGSRSRLYLLMTDGRPELLSVTGEERTSLGAIDFGLPQSVKRALAMAGDESAPVTLRLPASQALRTRFSLPAAAERNLDQVVGFEFERVAPFKREEAYYSWRVLSRDKQARSLEVELTILRRSDVDGIVTAAGETGLKVTMVEIAGASPGDPASIIPFEGAEARTRDASARLVIGGLAAVAGLLAVVCIALPFVRAERQSAALGAALAKAQTQAETSLAVEKQIEALLSDRTFLVDRRHRLPTVTELLDTVTRLTPDDTWLTELQIEGDQIHLAGAAESATSLLGVIDQSPAFSNAGFRASITQDGQLKRERFDISARIAPRGDGK